MNSEQLQSYVNEASQTAEIDPAAVSLLAESMACYFNILAKSVDAISIPTSDLPGISVGLLLLSNAANELNSARDTKSIDYLVGMGFEQSGELLSRMYITSKYFERKAIENDYWYRLSLSLLHYLAGGFRVQALSVVRNLESLSEKAEGTNKEDYRQAYIALRHLYSGKSIINPVTEWGKLLFSEEPPIGIPNGRIFALARRIQQRRRITLLELGEDNEAAWLRTRGINDQAAVIFWQNYIANLEKRGITSFTDDQIGNGFDGWLQPNRDLLVILPTGAGKTVIGELKSAITLAKDKQVIWILPTRSLVRQTKRELRRSFRNLGVIVEELPTTEDFQPLYTDSFTTIKYIAVTTPEKLAALIRTNPEAIDNVGLVVLDEAQNLFDVHRGASFEFVIHTIHTRVPSCKYTFMSAMADSVQRLRLFLSRLGPDILIDELISGNRPTRRISGVLTNTENNHPAILCYPPGLQNEYGVTIRPYAVFFNKLHLSSNSNSLSISTKVLKRLTESKLRTVLFVERKESTIAQARYVANAVRSATVTLLPEDIDRLRTEIGRESVVALFGSKGVAPHHAGLSPVEQHIIEKWTRSGQIKTVIATPTLAQGVNLPFDISILSFLRRYNPQTNQRTDITQSEILNMLGRAGRAGYVSDGICLIALPAYNRRPVDVLDQQRRHYFHMAEASQDYLGLSQLMIKADNSHINDPTWLLEYDNMSFSEAQALVSFSLRSTMGQNDIRGVLSTQLITFPSIQDLAEIYGETRNILDALSATLEPLVINLREECGEDVELMDTIMRTGLPIQVLRRFYQAIREDYDLHGKGLEERLVWADQVVIGALNECRDREWYRRLFLESRINLPSMLSSIQQWRSGAPLADIERNWRLRSNESSNQIAIGEFFNHKISLIAQFWGALSICEENTFPNARVKPLENIQTYVREGVTSVAELEWLSRTGGIDRVLAHILADTTPADLDRQELREYTRRQIDLWQENRNAIPVEIHGESLGALVSILNERRD